MQKEKILVMWGKSVEFQTRVKLLILHLGSIATIEKNK